MTTIPAGPPASSLRSAASEWPEAVAGAVDVGQVAARVDEVVSEPEPVALVLNLAPPPPPAGPDDLVVTHTDEELFADLVARHHVRLTHLAYMLCGNRAQAEDAVAEAYAQVWPRYRRGRIVAAFPYLRRAVVNQVNGTLRRRVLERREEQRCTVDARIALCAERVIDNHEVLRPALLALPMIQRTVVVLRFLEDLSEEETAAILGVKLGTVKSRTARALEQLRRLIGESFDG